MQKPSNKNLPAGRPRRPHNRCGFALHSTHPAAWRSYGAGAQVRTAERGLVVGGPDDPVVVLTVENVARIAALVGADFHG